MWFWCGVDVVLMWSGRGGVEYTTAHIGTISHRTKDCGRAGRRRLYHNTHRNHVTLHQGFLVALIRSVGNDAMCFRCGFNLGGLRRWWLHHNPHQFHIASHHGFHVAPIASLWYDAICFDMAVHVVLIWLWYGRAEAMSTKSPHIGTILHRIKDFLLPS